MEEFQKLIDDFNALKVKERKGTTFLEIARLPHLENVWSNILAFYINPNNEHGLSELILNSFFDAINEHSKPNSSKILQVDTEYQTVSGKRIDIVVIADNFILGIENKVDAGLYNDLKDYSETIDILAHPQNLPTYKILLSKYRNDLSKGYGFVNIIYTDLIKSIKRNIGKHITYSDTKYLMFLFDFLKTIENNIDTHNMEDNPDIVNFFHNNIEKISRLVQFHDKLNHDLVRKLDIIHNAVKRDEIRIKLDSLDKRTLFGGPGRFTWQGSPLIKYEVVINDISLLYQIGISNYKIVSHYWFNSNKYKYITSSIKEQGVLEKIYEHTETEYDIAKEIQEQIYIIISVLDNETSKSILNNSDSQQLL
jgi:hypothetical protein